MIRPAAAQAMLEARLREVVAAARAMIWYGAVLTAVGSAELLVALLGAPVGGFVELLLRVHVAGLLGLLGSIAGAVLLETGLVWMGVFHAGRQALAAEADTMQVLALLAAAQPPGTTSRVR